MGEAQKRKFLQKTRKVFKRFAEWQNACFPVSKQTDALPDGAAPKTPFPLSYTYARNAAAPLGSPHQPPRFHTLATDQGFTIPNTWLNK